MQLDGELLIQPGSWRKLGPLASDVRRAVFIVEQGIDESEEWDDVDAGAVHWVALLDGEAIGCARLSPEGKIGRMAVLGSYRGRGVGTALLQACVEYAAQRKFAQVKLSAQQHALSFYEKQGFKAVGPPHEEVGIAHQWMSRELTQAPQGIPLSEFMAGIKALVDALPAAWVTGTVSELRRQSSGHVYFTLVQTGDDGEATAKVRAIIWRTAAAAIEARFRQATGLGLANNQDIMVKVRAQSHAVHGFSLMVEDIHPEFTVGQLAARLEHIRRQLQAEGIFSRNRQMGLPQDFFRVAVLSPADAAGLGDFRSRADALGAAGIVGFQYFTATFQGPQTSSTICAALSAIAAAHVQGQPFDAVVIIRGGGSEWDLASLNDIDIARAVCNMPMPVLCGIGHERDSTIIDEIACHRLPTPSMVIDFIESTVMSRLQRVVVNMRDIQTRARQQTTRAADLLVRNFQAVCDQARGRADMAENRLTHLRALVQDASRASVNDAQRALVQNWRDVNAHARAHVADAAQAAVRLQLTVAEHARREVALMQQALNQIRQVTLPQAVRQRLETADVKLSAVADFVRSQDPADVLKRGYAIVMDGDGKPLTDAAQARAQSQLAVRFRDGSLRVTPAQDSAVNKNGNTFEQGE